MIDAAGALGLVFGIVIGLVISTAVADHKESEYRKEAVERNYAEWVVDQNGKTTWRWKEACSE